MAGSCPAVCDYRCSKQALHEKAKIERREKIMRNRERKTANRTHVLDDAPLQPQRPPPADGHGNSPRHFRRTFPHIRRDLH
ncbi:unnamed protein product [Dibothriocephalus latus]|uniref:Uncharacterized protein n=1 Tax=Dibothriocephalus latus TaxID=60516 RepID=A0A3P7LFM0_DIBLA|nr:unnamed protein product [Dibothriocephalus latus]